MLYKKITSFLLLSFFLSLQTAIGMEVSLPLLDYSDEAVIGENVGIRPCRKGGVRLEKQSMQDKAIFHNYGHGGSGVTLAPGCTEHVVSLFDVEEHESQRVSVLGAGYMGLMTAHQLAEKGHNITVYADQFPRRDYFYKHGFPCITSLVAGGLWLPFKSDMGKDTELFSRIQRSSFNFYKHAASDTSGVSMRNVYSFSFSEGRVLPPELDPPVDVRVTFGNGRYTPAKKWSTPYIDGNVYLNGLYETAESKGIKFEQRAFSDIDAVLGLDETYIFNCLGYDSKTVFSDTELYPVRGQLLYLRPQPGIDFFLSGLVKEDPDKEGLVKERLVTTFPSSDKITVWGTSEPDVEECSTNPEDLDQLLKNVGLLFKDKI